jgi:hypothetical protein
MPYHYTDSTREDAAHSLPDVEIFSTTYAECQCGGTVVGVEETDAECGDCGSAVGPEEAEARSVGFFYQFGFPGCMPDSDFPSGPYDSEEEALAAAREGAGYCAHGIPDDSPTCEDCDR